jgi:hypothetical protein
MLDEKIQRAVRDHSLGQKGDADPLAEEELGIAWLSSRTSGDG